jgi:hypothetical protein
MVEIVGLWASFLGNPEKGLKSEEKPLAAGSS